MDERCNETIYAGMWAREVQCQRTAKVERDGRSYCTQHDPVRVKEKAEQKTKQWNEKYAQEKERWRRTRVVNAFCEGVDTDVLEKLEKGWLAERINAAD